MTLANQKQGVLESLYLLISDLQSETDTVEHQRQSGQENASRDEVM